MVSKIKYSDRFYQALEDTAGPSARVIAPLVKDWISADSVVDVGCGDGSWLLAFQSAGVEQIFGIDGDWIKETDLKIPAANFQRMDLSRSIALPKTFDLALSLEVAEHLPSSRAAMFVADLVKLAPVVMFSAAIPLQEGPNHLNEQWQSYWAALFANHDYTPVDLIRVKIWNEPNVTWWYKQNTILYINNTKIQEYPYLKKAQEFLGETTRDLIHPEKYRALAKRTQPTFGRWLKMLPGTVKKRRKI